MPYHLPDGRIIQLDQPFVFGDVQYSPNWLRHASQADLQELGATWEDDPPPPPPPPPTVEMLLAHAAAIRWQIEHGGIVLNGALIRTDRDTRTNILGARTEAKEDPNYTLNWKVADGVYITLDAPTIIAIAGAIRVHVQACFDAEKVVSEAIHANTITTYEEVTQHPSWPSNS